MNRLRAPWLLDVGLAVLFALGAVTLERQTQGRIASRSVLLWIGLGSFALLRVGAFLSRAGRTLGCLFALAITWLLPFSFVCTLVFDDDRRAMVRDSSALFVLAGLLLIAIMTVTMVRLRSADLERHGTGGPG